MDAFEDQARDYPPRPYAERASNLENKDINHNFHTGDFPHVILYLSYAMFILYLIYALLYNSAV